jgi:DNA-binding transcriptional LysR family regulator
MKKRMEYRRLLFFAAVAEELHFTRAASRLRVAQPHLSQEIRGLERDLGVELFTRNRRSVVLTPSGRVFLEKVRVIFNATDDAVRSAQRASRGETGKLSVGFVSVAGYAVVPRAVAKFRRSHPDVELVLSELNSDEGVQAVRSGRLDVCLLHPPRNLEPALCVEIAWHERLAVVLPRGHKLASSRRVDLRKLKDEPLVLWNREIASCLHDEVIAACNMAGFEPRVAQRTVRLATVVSMAASSVGYALVPASTAQAGIKAVVFRPLSGAQPTVPMAFVWRRKDVAPALLPFMAAVQDAKAQTPDPLR